MHSKERAQKCCSELFQFTIDELLHENFSENKEEYKFENDERLNATRYTYRK